MHPFFDSIIKNVPLCSWLKMFCVYVVTRRWWKVTGLIKFAVRELTFPLCLSTFSLSLAWFNLSAANFSSLSCSLSLIKRRKTKYFLSRADCAFSPSHFCLFPWKLSTCDFNGTSLGVESKDINPTCARFCLRRAERTNWGAFGALLRAAGIALHEIFTRVTGINWLWSAYPCAHRRSKVCALDLRPKFLGGRVSSLLERGCAPWEKALAGRHFHICRSLASSRVLINKWLGPKTKRPLIKAACANPAPLRSTISAAHALFPHFSPLFSLMPPDARNFYHHPRRVRKCFEIYVSERSGSQEGAAF